MSSLADLPEVIGFFSYSREDDESFKGTLSALRDGIQRELSAQLGRSKKTFRLWQDQEAIAPGRLWESEIKTAVEQSVFFIPIVTPRAINSKYCQVEFEAFLARESILGRTDLVFPILYITVLALENEAQWRDHPVLSIVGKRQYVDWRPFRHLDIQTTAVREAIERFCGKIVEALHQSWLSPEERRRLDVAAAQGRADEILRQEAMQSAEEEARSRKEKAEAERTAEQRRHQEAATKQRAAEKETRGEREVEAILPAETAPRVRATGATKRAEEERAFAAAKADDTIRMVDAFLEAYPESHRSNEAKALRERLVERDEEFKKATSSDDPAVLKALLNRYPAGALQVKQRAEEERAFAAAESANTIRMLDAFLEAYPESHRSNEAKALRERLVERDEAYKRAMSSDDETVLDAFLDQYPGDKLADRVRNRLQRLDEEIAAQHIAEAAREGETKTVSPLRKFISGGAHAGPDARDPQSKLRAEEERAFAAAKADDTIRMVDAFLDTYPGGELVEEARILRERLTKRDEEFKKAMGSEDRGVLKAFLRRYPAGKLTEQIRNRLQRL
jgi:hypothetical protein